jgi:TatD DNase family protein
VIDSHCHLADQVFVEDLDDVVTRAESAGVTRALCILSADEPEEIQRAATVKAQWPAMRFAAGIHPHRAGAFAGKVDDALAVTRAAAEASSALAVGEIGLDYHYDFAPRNAQRDVFAAHVALAVERGQPVIVHSREAFDDTLAVLQDAGQGRVRGVIHCFTGTTAEARRVLDRGFFVSFGGIVTFPKANDLREVARFVPAEALLLETDAPFLAPVPHRGKRNEPAWVARTFEEVATVRSQPVQELDATVTANFDRLLGSSSR